ncbi:NUDIX domain-containing protein [Gorillibacterium massiliense]|uniref:NUDIX domain-containing protein n=1 Tax=Gorillibacterium massiliense TaxID=1280390 RepID=UPI001EE32AD8|nr:NUDIX domain-containing protein [Gorillibacterium massiliense]
MIEETVFAKGMTSMTLNLRLMATAMLFNGGDLLMMKRAPTRSLHPNFWAAVGGHIEPEEMNTPLKAILREIQEETGLTEQDLTGLRMQYILVRRKDDEIRQQFFYVGETLRRDVGLTEEGELHWIPQEEVLHEERSIPFVYRALLAHYFEFGPAPHLWMGTAGWTDIAAPGTPAIHWIPLIDPHVL